jgi:DNA-binding response OmpR family regulator
VKVHVVEDDKELQGAAQFLLKNKQFSVTTSTSGSTAADDVIKADPDAVLLDIMLPGKSGYEVLEEIRQKGYQKPVIVMSNLDQQNIDRSRLARSGVKSAFLKVTTKFDDIIEQIKNDVQKADTTP